MTNIQSIILGTKYNRNHTPVVVTISPTGNPKIIRVNNSQVYTVQYRDDEKDTVSISVALYQTGGAISNLSPVIITSGLYNRSNIASFSFTYLAPSVIPPIISGTINQRLIVTINDGFTPITQFLNIYIY